METTVNKKPHALMWIAGIAATAFSAVGIAEILGWSPTSMGQRDDVVVAKVETQHATRTARLHLNPPATATESVRAVDTKGEGTGLGAGGAVVAVLLAIRLAAGPAAQLPQ